MLITLLNDTTINHWCGKFIHLLCVPLKKSLHFVKRIGSCMPLQKCAAGETYGGPGVAKDAGRPTCGSSGHNGGVPMPILRRRSKHLFNNQSPTGGKYCYLGRSMFFTICKKNIQHNTCQLTGLSIFVMASSQKTGVLSQKFHTTITEKIYNENFFRQLQKNGTATETCNKQKILNCKK